MTASILSNNRMVPPFGMAGGAPGRCGRNYIVRAGGGGYAPVSQDTSATLSACKQVIEYVNV